MHFPIPLTDERRLRPDTSVHPELTCRALAFPELAREWLGAQPPARKAPELHEPAAAAQFLGNLVGGATECDRRARANLECTVRLLRGARGGYRKSLRRDAARQTEHLRELYSMQALARTLPGPAVGGHGSPAAAGHSDVELSEVGAGELEAACRPAAPEVPR